MPVEIITDEHGDVLTVAHTDQPLTPEARQALTEVAIAARAQLMAEDPDNLQADKQRRALDRLHKRETPECGHRRAGFVCTRPAGHDARHATACGTQRW